MAVTIKRDGFAQVEPNHLSAPRSGQVYAQLPADKTIDTLEQGMIVCYDYAAGQVAFTGTGPQCMVFNEEKLYDERHQMHKDYAMQRSDSYDGEIVPRVFEVLVGDIYTTNALANGEYAVGDDLKVDIATGFLTSGVATSGHKWKVVKETTMPDGQPAVKVQVVA